MRKLEGRILRFGALLAIVCLLAALSACAAASANSGDDTILFTDSAGRKVNLPKEISRVAPSGAVATLMLAILCPDNMVCVSGTPSSSQIQYLPPGLVHLPTTGQLYGTRSTINFESLIDADPQIIIDLGDRKDDIRESMDMLQKKTGIPTIFLEADLLHAAEAYRSLGRLLGKQERAEEIAALIDETMAMATENSAKIAPEERIRLMYSLGTSGLNVNAYGSMQAQVLDIVGVENAVVVEDISNSSGGTQIGLEQLYNIDPEAILFAPGSIFGLVSEMGAWASISAIKNGTYYEAPGMPYNWVSNPPSINMVLGVWWLGNLLYPEVYDYDMTQVAQRIYRVFWGYALSGEEARSMLANSTLRRPAPATRAVLP